MCGVFEPWTNQTNFTIRCFSKSMCAEVCFILQFWSSTNAPEIKKGSDEATQKTREERRTRTHSWPWNTSWDSSAIFHTLTERSLPPAVTHSSRLRLSSPVIASWCPKLQRIKITVPTQNVQIPAAGREIKNVSLGHSQSFHIRVLVHIPHLYRAIVRGAVQVISSPPEGKTLRRKSTHVTFHTRTHDCSPVV